MTENNGGQSGNGTEKEIPENATEETEVAPENINQQDTAPIPVTTTSMVDSPEEPELTEEEKKKRRRKKIAWLVAILLLLLWAAYIGYNYWELRNMDPRIYVGNDEEWTGWDGLDHAITDGTVRISRVQYVAPNIHYYFDLEEIAELQELAVLKVDMQLDRFINSTFSLMTVFTPAGNVSVILDRQGRIGLVSGPEGTPEFSERRIQLENQYEIYLFIDPPNEEISAYVDGTRVVSVDRNFDVYPMQDVWLGCVWIGGSNDFGAPLGYNIHGFWLGDEDLIIANYSLLELARVLLEEHFWLWIPPILAILIILALLIIRFIEKRKEKREEADAATQETI